MVTKPAPPAPPSAKTLACPSCGASLTVRAPGHSLSVVCSGCGAVLDAQSPDFAVIAKYEQKTKITPKIPLGARGKLRNEMYEVIGFLVRRIKVEDISYSWGEYLLFNPYLGLRWLTEYSGHWILAKAASGRPERDPVGKTVTYLGGTFRHFQTATAEAVYVLGEFPWRVRVGEKAVVEDYIDPPRVLSCEKAEKETTWSIGDHIEGHYLWQAFGLKGEPPAPQGVEIAQPSPYTAQARPMFRLFAGFVGAALLVQLLFHVVSQNKLAYEKTFAYERGRGNAAVVSDVFELPGRRSNVMIDIRTDLANNWAYFNLALVNEETGRALNFGREVGYYFGRDSDGAWSEGAPGDRVYLPSIEAGRYYLLIEPETNTPQLTYSVQVRRDVTRSSYFFYALGILVVPALIFWYRKRSFEYKRWAESDHPMWGVSDLLSQSEDDDDD